MENSNKLDQKDQQVLALLRDNARISVVEIARKIKTSRATAQNRVNRLESLGVILGYTVKMGSSIEKSLVRALACIQVESKKEAMIIKKLRGNPNITAVHHTTGKWDLIAELQTDTLVSFNRIIGELRLIDGITLTETNLLLDTYQ